MAYIVPNEFDYRESRWGDLYVHLKQNGFDVFSPGTKTGECIAPYLTVQYSGASSIDSVSSDRDIYTIRVYVPANQYSALEPLVLKVRRVMEQIKPLFYPMGVTTPSYYEDNIKAHYVSIDYFNVKKRL